RVDGAQQGLLHNPTQNLRHLRPPTSILLLLLCVSTQLPGSTAATPAGRQDLKHHAHRASGGGNSGAVRFQDELPDGLAVVVGSDAVRGRRGGGGGDGGVEPARQEVAEGHRLPGVVARRVCGGYSRRWRRR
ncbi:unnamed protein product, partial [Ectocarpus sp. 13 AM-2016]